MHHNILSLSQGDCAVSMSHGSDAKRVIVSHTVNIPGSNLRLTFFRPPWFNLVSSKTFVLTWRFTSRKGEKKNRTHNFALRLARDCLPAVAWSLWETNTSYSITIPMTIRHVHELFFHSEDWHCPSSPFFLSIRQWRRDRQADKPQRTSWCLSRYRDVKQAIITGVDKHNPDSLCPEGCTLLYYVLHTNSSPQKSSVPSLIQSLGKWSPVMQRKALAYDNRGPALPGEA